jgi:signal transduction histidine kinase
MKFGLARAITAHADSFQGKHPDLRLHLEIEQDNAALPEANRLTLYRIYQEALNNILKHAQASEVWIRLRMEAHGAALEIQDNGEGFILPGQWLDLARQGHLGLVGMQERAEAVGGAFQVHSRPGFGTTLYVSVPVTITLAP